MYCPKCRTEYREAFTKCADCGVPLETGAAPTAPHLDPVTILETADPFAFGFARSLLDDAGIDHFDQDHHVDAHIAVSVPFTYPLCRIMVAAEDEADARAALEPVLQPPQVTD